MLTRALGDAVRRVLPPPPPPPPPPRKEVDPAVRQPALHQGKADVPPPERYVKHTVEPGETLTEVSRRYQTDVPMLQAANPQVRNPDQIEIGQEINVPIGADYGREPTRDVVESGQTLTEMAREHPGVSAQDIARANRHEIPNADRIHPGQEIGVPNHRPPTPLEQKVQATDNAVADVNRAQRAYDELPADTNRAIRQEMHDSVTHAKGNLRTAVQAELDERVKTNLPANAEPTETDYATAGNQLKDRYQADAGATQKLDTALDSLKNERYRASPEGQAEALVNRARGAGDAPKQIEALNDGLKNAPPEVRDAAVQSQGYKDLLQGAADWAMEPLGPNGLAGDQPVYMMMERVEGQQAMERLDQLTQGMDPDSAAQLVELSLPKLEQYGREFNQRFGDNGIIGQQEMTATLRVLDRSADTPKGQANMQKMLDMGMWNAMGAHEHIAQGGRLDYVQAFGAKGPTEADTAQRVIETGMKDFRRQIEQDTKAYTEHMSELAWLVNNHGGAMTPEQLEQAITQYTAEMEAKEPGWEAKSKELQAKLGENGEKLLQQMAALGQVPQGGQIPDANLRALEEALNDPNAQMAIQMAFQQNPGLTQGPLGDKLLDFFANPTVKGSAKVTDVLRKASQEFVNAYVKTEVFSQIEGLDINNPTSVAQARQALEGLRDSRFAAALGVSPDQMNRAVDALDDAVPRAGDTAVDIENRMKTLNHELAKAGPFSGSTFPGQLLRGIGLGLAGVGFLASTSKAINDPSVKNTLKALSDAAGLGQKGTELLVGLGKVDANSRIGALGSKGAAKFLGVLGAGFDAWSAVDSFGKGDTESGLLYSAGAVGGVMLALGSGPVGWIGLALVGASAIGLWLWDGHKANSTHEPRWDDGRSMRFMQKAGLNEDAARTLADQSGEGYSPLPLLAQYAEHKGLDLQKPEDQQRFADWINGLSSDQLTALKDRANLTQDKIDGDLTAFGATSPDDASWQNERVTYTSHRDGYELKAKSPTLSAAQLDMMLQTLGVAALS